MSLLKRIEAQNRSLPSGQPLLQDSGVAGKADPYLALRSRIHRRIIDGMSSEGKGQISIRQLVRNALRMRPDRIIVGEVRGGEALDMLQAMNTGHDGSMTTGHANSPRDMISRLETMTLMAGMELPVKAIREQIASAIDLIIHQARLRDGSRKITHITEVQGMEGDVIVMQDLFTFDQTGKDEQGKIIGSFQPSGIRPTFIKKLEANGIILPLSIFQRKG